MSSLLVKVSLVCGFLLCVPLPGFSADAPCLDKIYPKGNAQNDADYRFNIDFDSATKDHRSLSCIPEIRASEAKRALERFRSGVLYRDPADLNAVLRFPLRIGIAKTLDTSERPETIFVRNAQEWLKFQDSKLTSTHIALVACSHLGVVTVESGRSPGFRLGLGFVWFQNSVGNQKVRVTSINVFPIDTMMLTEACLP